MQDTEYEVKVDLQLKDNSEIQTAPIIQVVAINIIHVEEEVKKADKEIFVDDN